MYISCRWYMIDVAYQQQNPPPVYFFLFSNLCGNRFTACGVVFSLLSTFFANISNALPIFYALNAETSVNYNLCCLAKSYPYSKETRRLSIWSDLFPTIKRSTPSLAYLNQFRSTCRSLATRNGDLQRTLCL